MKLFGLHFSVVCISCCCCCLMYGRGHGVCTEGKLITRINLTTELQSEILLPCLFEPTLTGSDLTINSGAEWTQINENPDYIVEIKVNGPESFWNNRHNRIKAFRDTAASGNFSILIRDVHLSDLGLYRCELFRDINCSLGYKEIEISLAAVEFSLPNNWQLIVAGGGFLLLCLITACIYYTWTKRQRVDASVNTSHNSHDSEGQKNDEITYASVVPKSHNCHDSDGQKNDEITYASVVPKSHNCHDSDGQKNDEITYASVVPKSHNCHDSEGQKNDEIIYASVVLKSHNYHDSEVLLNNNPVNGSASELVSPETVLYATVKQRERR